MGEMISTILENFGLKSHRTCKERGAFICNTLVGDVKITKTNDNPDVIYFAHAVKEQAAMQGFLATDRYFTTVTGVPFVRMGFDTFTAVRFVGRRELDLSVCDDVKQAVKQLALLHKTLRNVNAKGAMAKNDQAQFMHGEEILSQGVKQAKRQKKRTDFDMLLLNNADKYISLIYNAQAQLSATSYENLFSQAINTGDVCHNILKEAFLIPAAGELYITHFTHAQKNLHIHDLATFIRRYALKSNRTLSKQTLLEIYQEHYPQPTEMREILDALLLYPAPFLKVLGQYFEKKRRFTPAGILQRMESVLDIQAGYEAYVI